MSTSPVAIGTLVVAVAKIISRLRTGFQTIAPADRVGGRVCSCRAAVLCLATRERIAIHRRIVVSRAQRDKQQPPEEQHRCHNAWKAHVLIKASGKALMVCARHVGVVTEKGSLVALAPVLHKDMRSSLADVSRRRATTLHARQ